MTADSHSTGDSRDGIRKRHAEVSAAVIDDTPEMYIGGEWVPATDGATFETVDPTTGQVLADVPRGSRPDVDRAVERAWTAYEEEWSGYGAGDRQAVLAGIADAIEENVGELARIEVLDNGKPLREAKHDVYNAAEQFRYFAGIVRANGGETMVEPSRYGQVVREPYGVVGGIVPWNFPLLTLTWKVAPALAGGNSIVLKPAEQTPLSALRLTKLVDDVVPDGVLNIVTGYGEEAGAPIAGHDDIRKVAFTGSTAVGKEVMKNAADNVTDVTLELGGKSPIVVFDDADLGDAVRTVSSAIFANTGECCEAGSRLFVHDAVADDLLDGLVDAAEGMTIGDPLADGTQFGPKVSPDQVERTMDYLAAAREAGATFLTGGDRPDDETLADGCFVTPTIIEGLDHDHPAVQEEIFGPVLEVFRWDNYDEMMTLVNDVDYGLAAGVVTNDVSSANRAANDIKAGYVWVNKYHDLVPGLPFGGYKESGIGRELGAETLDAYTQTKTIHQAFD